VLANAVEEERANAEQRMMDEKRGETKRSLPGDKWPGVNMANALRIHGAFSVAIFAVVVVVVVGGQE
jgi:hypothetical protein